MPTFAPGDIPTAAQMNAFAIRYEKTGIVGSVVTVAPAGTITDWRRILITAWNRTSNTLISTSDPAVAPSGAATNVTDGTNTVQIAYPADGSITAQRTAGSATCEVHLIAI